MASPVGNPSHATVSAVLVQFVAAPPATAKIRRVFKQPIPTVAVEEPLAPEQLSVKPAIPVPTDRLEVVFVAPGGKWEPSQPGATAPDALETPTVQTIERNGVTVHWQPGRAVVVSPPESRPDVLAALTDFAFYEGRLRMLEAEVEAREPQAEQDIILAHRVQYRDRKQWSRIRETIEACTRLRLTYSRLEPHLLRGSLTHSPEVRKWLARFIRRAETEARLEAVSERLEALEDLYEGANDRIADYRWYRDGHLLEIGIIVLLLIEGILMIGELTLHYLDRRDARLAELSEENATALRDNSEEFRAAIIKVADGKVTFIRTFRDPTRTDHPGEQTLSVTERLLVARGRLDRDTREVDGDPIEGGLNNELFAKLDHKGLRAILVTDHTNKKIAEIYIFQTAKEKNVR